MAVEDLSGSDVSNRCRDCLQELCEAFYCARDVGLDTWQFALEISELKALGVRRTDLRWLLARGLVEHGQESTDVTGGRTFAEAGLTFTKTSCFVLTPKGEELCRSLLGPVSGNWTAQHNELEAVAPSAATAPGPNAPRWDAERRELLVGSEVIKVFRSPSHNQVRILAAFEEEGWPARIDDPLPVSDEVDPKQRLHDTIKSLNRNQRIPLLRFKGDGTGEGVRWELGR